MSLSGNVLEEDYTLVRWLEEPSMSTSSTEAPQISPVPCHSIFPGSGNANTNQIHASQHPSPAEGPVSETLKDEQASPFRSKDPPIGCFKPIPPRRGLQRVFWKPLPQPKGKKRKSRDSTSPQPRPSSWNQQPRNCLVKRPYGTEVVAEISVSGKRLEAQIRAARALAWVEDVWPSTAKASTSRVEPEVYEQMEILKKELEQDLGEMSQMEVDAMDTLGTIMAEMDGHASKHEIAEATDSDATISDVACSDVPVLKLNGQPMPIASKSYSSQHHGVPEDTDSEATISNGGNDSDNGDVADSDVPVLKPNDLFGRLPCKSWSRSYEF